MYRCWEKLNVELKDTREKRPQGHVHCVGGMNRLNTKTLACFNPTAFKEKSFFCWKQIFVCGQPNKFYSQETLKYSNSSETPLNENFTSALNYPLHNFCSKPLQHYTGIGAATYSLELQNKQLCGVVFIISNSNSQNLLQYPRFHINNLFQICQVLCPDVH